MKPSSSSSEPPVSPRLPLPRTPPGLFDEILARGEVRDAVSDRAWLQALLDAEADIAQGEHAAAVAAICQADLYDIATLAREAAASGNPVFPLVQAMRALLPEGVAASVHKGATTQDILDTAAMLVAHRALGPLLTDLGAAADAAARLAETCRELPMMGRTLLQEAEPVTFGSVAAGWMAALDEAGELVVHVRQTRLAVQFGGAVGLGEPGPTSLGLAQPVLSWHTNRIRVAELATTLGIASGVVGKIARDVTLLAQREVTQANPGASTAMPHKRNPVAAVSALACAMQAPGLVATILAAMVQEHERAAGAWHAEWRPLRELLTSTGSAVAWLRACLEGLQVRPTTVTADVEAAVLFVDRALSARRRRP